MYTFNPMNHETPSKRNFFRFVVVVLVNLFFCVLLEYY
jgi:hypothetical protein